METKRTMLVLRDRVEVARSLLLAARLSCMVDEVDEVYQEAKPDRKMSGDRYREENNTGDEEEKRDRCY